MTKAELIKIAKQNNVNLDRMEIKQHRGVISIAMKEIPADLIKKNLENTETGNIPEINRFIRNYNRQADRLTRIAVETFGVNLYGVRNGSGEWRYEFRKQTASERLANENID